jgi:hypothetical protein
MRVLATITLLIFLLMTNVSYGLDILQFNYYVNFKKAESLDMILSRFIRKGFHVVSNDKMMVKIIDANPHILNWHEIPKGERVELYIYRERANLDRIKRYLVARRELVELERKDIAIRR